MRPPHDSWDLPGRPERSWQRSSLTQSAAISQELVPLAGADVLSPRQIYPVTIGASLGTAFTALFAAFAIDGVDAKIGLQAAS